jgi:hypothetical protein
LASRISGALNPISVEAQTPSSTLIQIPVISEGSHALRVIDPNRTIKSNEFTVNQPSTCEPPVVLVSEPTKSEPPQIRTAAGRPADRGGQPGRRRRKR